VAICSRGRWHVGFRLRCFISESLAPRRRFGSIVNQGTISTRLKPLQNGENEVQGFIVCNSPPINSHFGLVRGNSAVVQFSVSMKWRCAYNDVTYSRISKWQDPEVQTSTFCSYQAGLKWLTPGADVASPLLEQCTEIQL